MKREEQQQTNGLQVKSITEKRKKDQVFRAVTTDEEGTTIELNNQEKMVLVIAESN